MYRKSSPALTILLAALVACDGKSPLEPQLTTRTDLLVSGEWLAARLQDPTVVVLHVGTQANYDAGHIPGARFVALAPLQPTRGGIPLMLAEPAVLREAFEAAGVSAQSHVVVTGDGIVQAARGFFMLEYLGHPRVSLLDGSKPGWAADGRALSTQRAAPPTRASLTTTLRADRLATLDWVRQNMQRDGIVLVDARSKADYAGEVEPTATIPRPGHIPGAHNVFWQDLVASTAVPRLKDVTALRTLYAATGAGPRSTIVAYCFSGMLSSIGYFVARYLGYDVKLYDGSMFEWSPRTELPVARCGSPTC
jgi:thiosulfate/3-mercaptopyruvate sulfurtransferase